MICRAPHHSSRRRLWLVALLGAALSAQAQSALPPGVAAALRDAGIADASLSALVLPLQGGAPRLAHFEQRPMAPASTMKLVTTLVALDELGPSFRWRTQLLSSSLSQGSVLRGPWYLRGGGDPNLTWDGLRSLLRTLRAQGVTRIEGDLILDRSLFQPTRLDRGAAPFDEAPDAYYNVIPDALLLNSNLIEFTLDSSQGPTQVRSQPPLERVRLNAQLKTRDGACDDWDNDELVAKAQPQAGGAIELTLSGTFPANCQVKTSLSLLDRNLYIERFVRSFWRELGGRWSGQARDGLTPAQARVRVEHRSDTLADAVKIANKTSDNALTRSLYLSLGVQYQGQERGALSLANGEAALRAWFARHGIATEGLVLDNGSGLSRLERISAGQLAGLLQAGARSHWFAEFATSLPIAGVDGSMRKRLRDTPAAGRARIKTGSLKDAVAVAGYVRDEAERDWVVVAFINDAQAKKGRAALDALIRWTASTEAPVALP